MNPLRQIVVITLANLRCIPQRLAASSVIVIGIAGVVAVLVSVLSMAEGLRQTIANTGSPDRAIVLSRGAESEADSSLPRMNTLNIMGATGIERAPDGKPIASAELLVQARVVRRSDGTNGFVTLRGVGQETLLLHPELKLIAGRWFQPGVHELVVGQAAQRQFAGLDPGNRIVLRDGEWTVVGIFSSQGNSHESELLTDAETALSAYRGTSFQNVTVRLASTQAYNTLKTAISADPSLTVDVKREPEYFAAVSKPLNQLLKFIAYLIGGVMAVGAVAGALNTMYSAVNARSREVATLRAIGFSNVAVVSSVLIEALLLATLGAAIGVVLAYGFFDGRTISTSGGSDNSQLVYALKMTPELVALGLLLGFLVGLLGGLFPAVHLMRRPLAVALRGS